LVTAPEILFFWVARMLMAGYHFMDQRLPFTTVYLHGTVRDTLHRKMSKSLGNGIDPLDVVRLYGADALRWTLIAGSSLGADVTLDPNDLETTFAPGRNFANKLWNIGRFILAQLPERVQPLDALDATSLPLADRWILARTQYAIEQVTQAFDEFRLDDGAKFAFQLAWRDLADWYVEAVKPRLVASGASADTARSVLAYAFDIVLRLLHPVVPFITEELWQKLPGRQPEDLLIIAEWPRVRAALYDQRAWKDFGRVQEAVSAIRNIRAEYRIPPKARLEAALVAKAEDAHKALGDLFLGAPTRDLSAYPIEAYSKAIELRPFYAEAHVGLGDARAARGEVDGAIVAYRKAFALDPFNALPREKLGKALTESAF